METIKVVYNTSYGGFKLPYEFCKKFKQKYEEEISSYTIQRDDERIIEMLEESDWFEESDLAIAEIPAGCEWDIHEYDGKESVGWHLPEADIIEDLRLLLIGDTSATINPLTRHFLDSGKSFKEFEVHFRTRFNLMTKNGFSRSTY